MRKLIGIAFLFIATITQSQEVNSNIGSRSAAMGRVGVCLSDIWSCQNNQAGLAFLENPQVGVYYQNYYLTENLSQQGVSFAYPMKKNGIFGLMYEQYGNGLYTEMKVGLAYSMRLWEKISAGVQFDYLGTNIQGYGKAGCITFEIGLQAYITDEIILGAHVFNPQQARYEKNAIDRIPAIFDVGIAYNPDNFLITAEIEKNIELNYLLRVGAEYSFNDKFFIRAGFSTNQACYSLGFGMEFNHIKINISSSLHQSLGYSPQADIIYEF